MRTVAIDLTEAAGQKRARKPLVSDHKERQNSGGITAVPTRQDCHTRGLSCQEQAFIAARSLIGYIAVSQSHRQRYCEWFAFRFQRNTISQVRRSDLMSHPSLRGMETRVLAGVRTGTTFTQLFHAWRHLSTRCVSDLASQSCPSLSTHARDRHRPSSGLKPSGLDCTTRIPSKFMSVGTRCSRKRPLERRWLSNKASAGDGNSPCWKCTSPVELRQFFCDCGAAQLLDERLDYFEMFHQSPSVLVDANDIEKQFKNMQRAFHPVSYASSPCIPLLILPLYLLTAVGARGDTV